MANSNFAAQGSPVTGAYAQPAPGITEAVVTPADPSGNAYATSLAASGTANLQVTQYRDSVATAGSAATVTSAASGGTIVSITPGTAGLWETSGYINITGTTVAGTDSNNMKLVKTGTALITPLMVTVPGTVGTTSVAWPLPAVIASMGTADTFQVLAIAGATTGAVYQATLVARRVG